MTKVDNYGSTTLGRSSHPKSTIAYFLQIGLAALTLGSVFGFVQFYEFLESANEAQMISRQRQDLLSIQMQMQRCAEAWPLKGDNYEACTTRARM